MFLVRLEKLLALWKGEIKGRFLVYWRFCVVPFEDFRYCFVRVAYLLQNYSQVINCFNTHLAPTGHT
jgi:hypothetical protein